MKTISLFLLLGGISWGACANPYCSAVTPNAAVTAAIADSGLGSTSMHVDIRLHGQNWASVSNVNPLLNFGGFQIAYLGGSSLPHRLFISGPDTISTNYGDCSVDLGASPPADITFRINRNVAGLQIRVEAFNTSTGAALGNVCTYTITSTASGGTIQGNGISFGAAGGAALGGGAAFIRWCTGSIAAAVPVPIAIASPCTIADYEFYPAPGNQLDTSGHSQTLTGGTLAYSDTPIYAPACPAFSWLSFKVGAPATLDASGCYALNGSLTLTYAWTVVAGADGITQGVTITSPTAVTTTTSNLTTFGSANFQVIVTDTSAQTLTTVAHYGAVNANSVNAIDLTTEGLTSAQRYIAGVQGMWGTNTWTWADNRVQAEAQVQLCNLLSSGAWGTCSTAQVYAPFWRTFKAGTASLQQGIAGVGNVVTGSGTAFLTDFSLAGGSAPKAGAKFVWRYTGTDAITHYTMVPVISVTDNTHLVIGINYPSSPIAPWPTCNPCAGLSYGEVDDSSLPLFYWQGSASPGNYYDVVRLAKINYWRSGIDFFWTLAQTQALYWMEFPLLDYYFNCGLATNNISPGSNSCFPEARNYALTGMIMHEQDSGNAFLLPSVRAVGSLYAFLLSILPTYMGLNDVRNDAYELSGVALLGLIDPAYSTNLWQTTVRDRLTVFTNTKDAHGTGWQIFYSGPGQTSVSAADGSCSCTISASTGSPTITGTGTSFTSGMVGSAFWSYTGTATLVPTSNASGDSKTYVISAVNVGAQTLTLTENYAGTTNLTGRGFAVASSGLVAWGYQPFMEGHLAQAFYYAEESIRSFAPTQSAVYKTYGHAAVNDLVNSVPPDNGGLYYGLYFPNCPPGMLNTATNGQLFCYGTANGYGSGPSSPSQSRTLATEAMRAVTLDYQENGTNATLANLLMSQMFCAPTFSCPVVADGYYLSDYNDGGTFLTALVAKWAGTLDGYTGAVDSWYGVLANAATVASGSVFRGPIRFGGNSRTH